MLTVRSPVLIGLAQTARNVGTSPASPDRRLLPGYHGHPSATGFRSSGIANRGREDASSGRPEGGLNPESERCRRSGPVRRSLFRRYWKVRLAALKLPFSSRRYCDTARERSRSGGRKRNAGDTDALRAEYRGKGARDEQDAPEKGHEYFLPLLARGRS